MNIDNNNNINFNNNIELAYLLCEKQYSHNELINMLNNGSNIEKQIAALKLDSVYDIEEAQILLNNLTGTDGKIREAVALKINSILSVYPKSKDFFCKISPTVFADATIDINGNICRLIIDSASSLKFDSEFSTKYTSKLIEISKKALSELDKFIFKDKKYVINKQIFKLYWSLEALKNFYLYADKNELSELLTKCINQKDYTIREKTAQIIANSGKFEELKRILINDKNYYVKKALNHHSIL